MRACGSGGDDDDDAPLATVANSVYFCFFFLAHGWFQSSRPIVANFL